VAATEVLLLDAASAASFVSLKKNDFVARRFLFLVFGLRKATVSPMDFHVDNAPNPPVHDIPPFVLRWLLF